METGRRGRDVDTRAWRRRYSRNPGSLWRPLAEAILEASYEATLLAAALNARANPDRPRAKTVFLTALGGGVFIATGQTGTDISRDGGRTWSALSDLGFHCVEASPPDGSVWFAGPNGRAGRLR